MAFTIGVTAVLNAIKALATPKALTFVGLLMANLISNVLAGLVITTVWGNLAFTLLFSARNEIEKYELIMADPPDINYQQMTSVSLKAMPLSADPTTSNAISLPYITKYLSDLNTEASVAEAFVHSIERYDGAVDDQDPIWTVIHGKQSVQLSNQLSDQIEASDRSLSNMIDVRKS